MDGASSDAQVYCSRLDKDVGVVVVIVDDEGGCEVVVDVKESEVGQTL